MKCAKCGTDLPAREDAGRPKTFCGEACKRSAEMEIRRINNHLENLEKSISHIRLYGLSSTFCPTAARSKEDAIATFSAEIEIHEARLQH